MYLRRTRKRLQAGEIPRLNRWYPGLAELIAMFGLDERSLYIPSPRLTQKENARECKKWWDRKRYAEQRLEVGEYSSQQERKDQKGSLEDWFNQRYGEK